MHDLPMEGAKCSQGIMPWTLKSGYTDRGCVTNANPQNHWLPFLFYICYNYNTFYSSILLMKVNFSWWLQRFVTRVFGGVIRFAAFVL